MNATRYEKLVLKKLRKYFEQQVKEGQWRLISHQGGKKFKPSKAFIKDYVEEHLDIVVRARTSEIEEGRK